MNADLEFITIDYKTGKVFLQGFTPPNNAFKITEENGIITNRFYDYDDEIEYFIKFNKNNPIIKLNGFYKSYITIEGYNLTKTSFGIRTFDFHDGLKLEIYIGLIDEIMDLAWKERCKQLNYKQKFLDDVNLRRTVWTEEDGVNKYGYAVCCDYEPYYQLMTCGRAHWGGYRFLLPKPNDFIQMLENREKMFSVQNP